MTNQGSSAGSARSVIVGVGAGIAAYKITGVVRGLVKAGFEVHVLPTPRSLEFVGSATWEALSGNPVEVDVFADSGRVEHVELARGAELVILAPATADLLAKVRLGLAPGMLENVLLASRAPLLVAPAMHTGMWEHPATRENVEVLKSRGVHFVGPVEGPLSSGDTGWGRLAEETDILARALEILAGNSVSGADSSGAKSAEFDVPGTTWGALPTQNEDGHEPILTNLGLAGTQVTISAGGTREPIDPVRFIGNRSSGRFGCEIAKACARLGAKVTLLAANIATDLLPTDPQIKVVPTPNTADLFQVAKEQLVHSDVFVMAAAVADFTPAQPATKKIKKVEGETHRLHLDLVETPDILAYLATHARPEQVVVGFAAETGEVEQVLEYGRAKARRKGADLLLVNRVGDQIGFGDVDTTIYVLDRTGKTLGQASGSKAIVAEFIAEKLAHQIDSDTRHSALPTR